MTQRPNTVRAEPVEALPIPFDKPALSNIEGFSANGRV
ncbi:Uncharacterized protein ToN1_41990 [Aromatoleum petrolei]|nr:Uncharacterized protein ToN1_41990 [Aromatoleum petrolei]